MNSSRVRRGRESEAAVAQYLRQHYTHATQVGAGRSGTDVVNVPMDVEVFARRDGLTYVMGKLNQQEARGGADRVLVMRPDGWGPATVHLWPAILRLEEYVALYRKANP